MACYIGRRGVFLLFLAELDVFIGYSLIAPLPFGLSASAIYRPFVEIMPIGWWAALWAGVGLLCLAAALRHPLRAAAFVAASVIKTVWASVYLAGWIEGTLVRGWLSAVIFLTFAAIVMVVSGWRENDQ